MPATLSSTYPVIDNPLNEFSLDNWENYFVEKEPRQAQIDAMEFIAKHWRDSDQLIINAPPGVGKSAIALTIARTLAAQVHSRYADKEPQPGYTYITTTSIELQNQYMQSYEQKYDLKKLYGAANFKCNRPYPMNCKEGSTICKSTKTLCPRGCTYENAKKSFIDSPYGIMNLTYFMYESHYARVLPKRGLMIFDEAHNIGDQVQDFVTITISDFHLKNHGIRAPKPTLSDNTYRIEELKKWIANEYTTALRANIGKLAAKKEAWSGSKENKDYLKLCNELDDLESMLDKVSKLFNELNATDWIAEKTDSGINITPITPKKYMRQYLIGKSWKNIFMSATLFDKQFLMEEYDLDPRKTCYFTTPSSFPVKNRPIYILPAGKIKYNDLKNSIKPFAGVMRDILDGHKNERGIVFVSSYAQADEFIRQVGSDRLITHYASKDKESMMEKHRNSKDTVIVSPSMHEGVDLVGDLSRFQVLLKMPFLSLGSASIKKRADLYPSWYAYQTALQIIQATGRSIRTENDVASTYVLDANWIWWAKQWSKFLPSYWTAAIVHT